MKLITSAKLTTSAAAILALAATIPTGAHADQILMGGLLPDALNFTPQPGDMLNVSTSGFSNLAQYGPEPDMGQVHFGAMVFTTDPLMPGPPGQASFFPITSPAATESFSYIANFADPDNSGPDFPDQMTMTITWNQLVNAGEEELDGTGVVLTSSGDTAFTTDFPVGGATTVTGFFPTDCQLGNFGSGPCDILAGMQIGKFEGGDTTPGGGGGTPGGPGTPFVPEPMSSFMALGLALCCLWGAYQFTGGKPDQSGLRFRHETNA
jgi:hypothetical protein